MRKIIDIFILLCLFSFPAFAQGPAIKMTGPMGIQGNAAILGWYPIVLADADVTLTAPEYASNFLLVTGTLTATRNLIAPLTPGQQFTVDNNTTGGQSITIGGATGVVVVIQPGHAMTVACDGANYISSSSTPTGVVTSVSVTNANGVSGVVATPTSTPAITFTLGDINPSSIGFKTPAAGFFTRVEANMESDLLPTGTATALANFNSATWNFLMSYWTGYAASDDSWSAINTPGGGANPTSTLEFLHLGSSGTATVDMPALTVNHVPVCTTTNGACNGTIFVPYSQLTGQVPTWNQNTTGNASTATVAISANSAATAGTAGNVTGIVAVVNGGTGTATPSLAQGTNVTITGTWPNQTINAAASGGASPGGTPGAMQYNLTSSTLGGLNGTGFAFLNGASAPTVATAAQITTTVNSVPCAAGGACTIPTTVCGGSGTSCPLQQINPTTGASTTTTASITTSATTIPVASCTGFTFTPGSIIAIVNVSPIEWVVGSACSAGNLTVSARGFYGTSGVPWASGSTVIQMISGSSTSATAYPYFYQLANGATGYGGSGNTVANTYSFASQLNALGGFTASGSVTMTGGNGTIYSPQVGIYNAANSGSVCFTSGTLFQQHSDSIPWFAGVSNASCTTGTNGIAPNTLVFTPGTTGSNPTSASVPGITVTTAGAVNVPAGGSYNINGVPITGGGGTVTYTASTTASAADSGKFIIMNCSAACSYTLPATQPSTTWSATVSSQGRTVATIALGGSDTFNGTTAVPIVNSFRLLHVFSNSAVSTDYRGDAPLTAGANITFTPTANGTAIAGPTTSTTVQNITVAGTSILYGTGATVLGKTNAVALLSSGTGAQISNWAIFGSLLSIDNKSLFKYAPPSLSVPNGCLFESGENDPAATGASVYAVQNMYLAVDAWCAVPNAYRIMASAASKTGTWTANGSFAVYQPATTSSPGTEQNTVVSGSTLSFSVPSNPSSKVRLYFGTSTAGTGTFTVSVNGSLITDDCSGTTTFGSGFCNSYGGVSQTAFYAEEYAAPANTAYTVVVTATNTAGVDVLAVDWNPPSTNASNGIIIHPGVLANYASYATLNPIALSVVNGLIADGLKDVYVDVVGTYGGTPAVNGTTDMSTSATALCPASGNANHPNDCGQTHYYQTIINAEAAAGIAFGNLNQVGIGQVNNPQMSSGIVTQDLSGAPYFLNATTEYGNPFQPLMLSLFGNPGGNNIGFAQWKDTGSGNPWSGGNLMGSVSYLGWECNGAAFGNPTANASYIAKFCTDANGDTAQLGESVSLNGTLAAAATIAPTTTITTLTGATSISTITAPANYSSTFGGCLQFITASGTTTTYTTGGNIANPTAVGASGAITGPAMVQACYAGSTWYLK